jgi:hypothetical protein
LEERCPLSAFYSLDQSALFTHFPLIYYSQSWILEEERGGGKRL